MGDIQEDLINAARNSSADLLAGAVKGQGDLVVGYVLSRGTMDAVGNAGLNLLKGTHSLPAYVLDASTVVEILSPETSNRERFALAGSVAGARVGEVLALAFIETGPGSVVAVVVLGTTGSAIGYVAGGLAHDAGIAAGRGIIEAGRGITSYQREVDRGVLAIMSKAGFGGIANVVAGGAECFPAETAISVGDGKVSSIKAIRTGGLVASYVCSAGCGLATTLVLKRVTRLFHNITDTWIVLSNGLTVTPGHHSSMPMAGSAPSPTFLRPTGASCSRTAASPRSRANTFTIPKRPRISRAGAAPRSPRRPPGGRR